MVAGTVEYQKMPDMLCLLEKGAIADQNPSLVKVHIWFYSIVISAF